MGSIGGVVVVGGGSGGDVGMWGILHPDCKMILWRVRYGVAEVDIL